MCVYFRSVFHEDGAPARSPMASMLSRIARLGSRTFISATGRASAGRGITIITVDVHEYYIGHVSIGRGYSTAGSTTLRCAGVSVGALLAGSAAVYSGKLFFQREGSPTLLPTLQAATYTHQPSVRGTHY